MSISVRPSREYSDEEKLEGATLALIAVAARHCGSPQDLRSGMDPVLSAVLGALTRLGAVERFEHREEFSGAHGIDYVGLRFTEEALAKLRGLLSYANRVPG